MEKIEFENQLLDAIKRDDLKSFLFLMPSDADLNLCYGRFPLLSLMYLYSSYKILSKFEKKLLQIHNFRVVDEKIELYKKFRKHAGKSLRFFSGDEIVHPILMLAVLDERIIIQNKYNFLYKNAEILNKIENIYNLNHKTHVSADLDYLKIPERNLTKSKCVTLGLISLILTIVVALSSVFMILVTQNKGLGLSKKPLKISNAKELVSAFNQGDRYYTLKNDITISALDKSVEEFSGVLDGAGFVLNIDGEITSAMIQNLTGIIKNIKIKLNNNQIKITQNTAIISKNNCGLIENCVIFGNFNQNYSADEEVFVGLFTSENNGLISNCTALVSGSMQNYKESNAFFGVIAGQNQKNGNITSCVTETGIIIADTVDIAGLVGCNRGKIENSENKVKISQTSEKEWHPNVAGIVVSNYGEINACKNKAELSSNSTVSLENENSYYVFVGGISCENYGDILNCSNEGEIRGKGDVSNVVASGISSQNIKNDEYQGLIKNCTSASNIQANSQTGQVCVGGIVGINSSVILNSGASGMLEANSNNTVNKAVFMNELDKALAIVSGGVVGVNQNAVVQNCYSYVDYVSVVESSETLKIYSGLIGSVGMFKFNIWASVNGEDVYSKDYSGDALDYVYNNYYVAREFVKQGAYGIYGTLEQKIGGLYYKSGSAEVLDETLYESAIKKCATFNDIPEEVRTYA